GSPAAPGGAATSTPAAPTDEPPTPRARPSDGGQGGHVPGGPTATVDDDELRPKPFIEGNDPKLP
ncbi:response regulator, partial [Promicromonospora citrea]